MASLLNTDLELNHVSKSFAKSDADGIAYTISNVNFKGSPYIVSGAIFCFTHIRSLSSLK